jgi:hypothetical protein
MKTQKIELYFEDPDQVSVVRDPKLEDVYHVQTFLSFKEINKLKRGNANVRPPEQKRKPFKAMKETVEYAPNTFQLKNRGITYICNNVEVDKKNNKLIVEIPDGIANRNKSSFVRYGIADGGHTFEVITQTVAEEKDYDHIVTWKMPTAKVHFLVTKNQDLVEPIVEALNTSLQVQQYSLDEYNNKFEPLKEALRESGFDLNVVAFRENEDKEWHVIEVIQRLGCFLKDRWVGTQPLAMYKSKGKALKLFTTEDGRQEFSQLYPVIKDVLTLPEYIQSEFSRGGKISAKSLAKLKCVKPLKKTYSRPGTTYSTDHQIDLAALLPMAAAFRELLYLPSDGQGYEWRMDYKEVFAHCAERLYSLLTRRIANVPMSNMIGSDVEYWTGCVQIVNNAREDIRDLKGRPSIRKPKKEVREDDELDESQLNHSDDDVAQDVHEEHKDD